ncbi:MAG: cytochrome c [Fimbriimonadaceae bacterium]|nr:cytochrome c [Alphaproteobacteria bacterium]
MSVFLLHFPTLVLADGNAKNGEAISRQHCMRCHVVSQDNLFAGIGSTPSFMLLVNALADWEERFTTFYARRPHPVHIRVQGVDPPTSLPSNAAPINLRLDEVDDILAYARSLKKE